MCIYTYCTHAGVVQGHAGVGGARNGAPPAEEINNISLYIYHIIDYMYICVNSFIISSIFINIHVHIYIYICTCIYIYIYIYRERER